MNYLALLEAIIASAIVEKDEDFLKSEVFDYYIKTLLFYCYIFRCKGKRPAI